MTITHSGESILRIEGLRAGIDGTEILRGIDLEVRSGEVHAVMGPNGAGKSTLGKVLLGHPDYEVLGGVVTLNGLDLLSLSTWERAQAGLFFAPQDPIELPGVLLSEILGARPNAHGSPQQIAEHTESERVKIRVPSALVDRGLNVGCSGGEKKRLETLQLALSGASIAILDEIDSGLDIDALREVSSRIEQLTHDGESEGKPSLGVLAVTHYRRLLEVLRPDVVHVLIDGRIVKSGGPDLSSSIEDSGYALFDSVDNPQLQK